MTREPPVQRPVIECVITAPGYRSSIELPIDTAGADTNEAFCAWFKMQLDYFGRWKPGATINSRETIPTKKESK